MQIPKIKHFIFDMDGVIIDSTPEVEAFWEEWARKENVPFDDEIVIKYIHGRTSRETIQNLFSKSTTEVRKTISEAATAFDLNMRPGLIKGAGGFLKQLYGFGYSLGLVTSSPKDRIKILLELHNIYHVFENIISGDDIINGKPDPEPYLKMATLINVEPAECVVFEDSNSGIQSALAAGMHVVSVGNTNLFNQKILFNIRDFGDMSASEEYVENLILN
jgi:sugar-phosphatase